MKNKDLPVLWIRKWPWLLTVTMRRERTNLWLLLLLCGACWVSSACVTCLHTHSATNALCQGAAPVRPQVSTPRGNSNFAKCGCCACALRRVVLNIAQWGGWCRHPHPRLPNLHHTSHLTHLTPHTLHTVWFSFAHTASGRQDAGIAGGSAFVSTAG